MGWVVNGTSQPPYPRQRDPVPNLHKAVLAPVVETLVPTGIRSTERPARNKSVYQPHIPAYKVKNEWRYTSTPPICVQGVDRDFFLYITVLLVIPIREVYIKLASSE
jgi:hypothetical protein